MTMQTENLFISSDDYEGIEQLCSREAVAKFYLQGEGLEIGALHKPIRVSEAKCKVRYVDYKSTEENRVRYPELANDEIVDTDIVDDGFILKKVEDSSVDFIIANHALEHSPDPFGTLLRWTRKLRSQGVIYVTIPIAEKCYDKGREITSLEHLIADHELFNAVDKKALISVTRHHIQDFLTISDKNIRIMNGMEDAKESEKQQLCDDLIRGLEAEMALANTYDDLISAHINKINRIYDIHYHAFTPSSYERFLKYFCFETKSVLENVIKNGSGECIGIIRKR